MPSQFEKALVDFVNISADYNTGSLSSKAVMYQLYVASVLPKDLTGFVELAYCLRHYHLPDPEQLPVSNVCMHVLCVYKDVHLRVNVFMV